jgi:hypothetical protein
VQREQVVASGEGNPDSASERCACAADPVQGIARSKNRLKLDGEHVTLELDGARNGFLTANRAATPRA